MNGSRPITQQKANNLHAGREKLMKSIKVAVFFDIIYPKVISHNTVFIATKYMLRLIYFSLALLYFVYNGQEYIPREKGGGAPRCVFWVSSNGLIRYQHRKLLATALFEKRSHFANTFTPLKV
ncbi:MAG: hypothetical protein WCO26_16175 [Deltaproteobacteria bacterium]